MEVIKSWNIPYPGGVPNRREPKEYRIVRFEDNTLAFCKVDLTPEIVGHEAAILKHLDGLAFVPALLRQELPPRYPARPRVPVRRRTNGPVPP